MNLFEHTQTIKRWISSCNKTEQLDLCVDVIKEFVTKRFEGDSPAFELAASETELANLISERRIILAAHPVILPDGENKRDGDSKITEL